ncbi:hypothetical protein MBEHAL_0406 [Halarchaeum acidiphilum MH1-52-1]|uniref:HMA domain-containing protein n=1 Tax=Halarchaeum acidiphilum MH1-52-1 TaxID=1261545 RepID=U2YDA6_9EURY|nr:heavy metal-associated domain-containing protein [Halarchaeum acidiphilum]GAD51646.1 hypothetical protein MBEHAL_0406 [Halarchaeum acidiphilum MH1-52-1]
MSRSTSPRDDVSYDRYELSVVGLRSADESRLAERIERAPGVREVRPDADASTVELVAEGEVAVGDAEWVLESAGYRVR